MNEVPVRTAPSAYEVVFIGHPGSNWSRWTEGWSMRTKDDGTTVLTGRSVDQAKLHGLLATIRNLNLPLVSVNPIDTASR